MSIEEFKNPDNNKEQINVDLKAPKINDKYTLMVDLPEELFNDVADKINIDGIEFVKKEEFHATVFGFLKSKLIKNIITENPRMEEKINNIANEIEWNTVVNDEDVLLGDRLSLSEDQMFFTDEQKKIKAENDINAFEKSIKDSDFEISDDGKFEKDRRSIIRKIEVPGIAEFYQRMKEKLDIDLGEIPPAHVTLYVTEDNKWGIGVNTEEELKEKTIKKVKI